MKWCARKDLELIWPASISILIHRVKIYNGKRHNYCFSLWFIIRSAFDQEYSKLLFVHQVQRVADVHTTDTWLFQDLRNPGPESTSFLILYTYLWTARPKAWLSCLYWDLILFGFSFKAPLLSVRDVSYQSFLNFGRNINQLTSLFQCGPRKLHF